MKKLNLILTSFKTLLLISAVFCIAACTQCGQKNKVGGNEEGVIEFDTKGVDDQHPLYGLAPSSATLKFKKEKFIIEMSTMGMFNTTIIGDTKTKTVAQTVKFMDIKQACIENENEVQNDNKDYELQIEQTKETKKIAGLKCYKLNVTMANKPTEKFTAWYTKDLGMEDCNLLNPYSSVKGVLMDYRVKKMGLEMHFVAKSYNNIEVPDNVFEVPASMKIVSKEEMAKFFANLQ